jgi:hypothetical protein
MYLLQYSLFFMEKQYNVVYAALSVRGVADAQVLSQIQHKLEMGNSSCMYTISAFARVAAPARVCGLGSRWSSARTRVILVLNINFKNKVHFGQTMRNLKRSSCMYHQHELLSDPKFD